MIRDSRFEIKNNRGTNPRLRLIQDFSSCRTLSFRFFTIRNISSWRLTLSFMDTSSPGENPRLSMTFPMEMQLDLSSLALVIVFSPKSGQDSFQSEPDNRQIAFSCPG